MKSFINLKTGVIEIPNNRMVIEQYQKRTDLYAEYKPVESKKANNEPTLNELKKKAKEMGVSIKVETNGVNYGLPETLTPFDYMSWMYQQYGLDPSTLTSE